MINVHPKFEVSSLSRSRDILGGTKNLTWVTWRDHAPFRDILSSVSRDLLCSTHILSLKCLRLPATKKWRAIPNVKIFVLYHPLGDLGVTYTVHLWPVGKRVVDFPISANWTFFASSYGWGAMSKYWSKLRCLKGGRVTLSANFRGRGSSTNEFWRQKTRVPGLSRGVVCVILRLDVLIQYRRVTHTHIQTDRHIDTRWWLLPAQSKNYPRAGLTVDSFELTFLPTSQKN